MGYGKRLFTHLFTLGRGNLAVFLSRFGAHLTTEQLREMCKDVLQMLEQLRSCEILHRDFKAHNIVVSKTNRLCLIDFGSAVEVKHRLALTGRFLTTAHVRSPEIMCESNIYSYGVDAWAAGCIIWRILTGGDVTFPTNRTKIIQTKDHQMKCQIGQLRNVLGTSVKCTNKGTIPIRSEKLYHELCSWPSRERIVASTFFERLSVQVKKKKITAMSYSSTKDA